MNTVYFDSAAGDDTRRGQLYDGDLHVMSPFDPARALCALAQDLSVEAFGETPTHAQFRYPVEEYVAILADLKPKFIHHPKAKEIIRDLLEAAGCDVDRTYFDVPRLRTMAHGDYLRAGLALPFHPHRDTWFSAPFQQLNWWMPVYPIVSECSMAFHSRYWTTPVANSSDEYDYDRWNLEGRTAAATQIKKDTRKQPIALEDIDPEPQTRLITDVGGVVLFSAAQLHSTVDNTSGFTRFSIDFRTVNLDDLEAGRAAHNIDSACTGTTLGDYVRASDLSPLPSEIIERYRQERAVAS